MTIKILCVCLGNICRSPTAEGVLRQLIAQASLSEFIQVDSAGTANWHSGHAPDPRTIAAAKKRGIDLSTLRARQVHQKDFEQFHYILAMDDKNLAELKGLMPKQYQGYLGLLLPFGSQSQYASVPDPYHGNADDFELVLDLVADAAAGLLQSIQQLQFSHVPQPRDN